MSETNEIKIICTELNNTNKKYVIAVAQALKFSQTINKEKNNNIHTGTTNRGERSVS